MHYTKPLRWRSGGNSTLQCNAPPQRNEMIAHKRTSARKMFEEDRSARGRDQKFEVIEDDRVHIACRCDGDRIRIVVGAMIDGASRCIRRRGKERAHDAMSSHTARLSPKRIPAAAAEDCGITILLLGSRRPRRTDARRRRLTRRHARTRRKAHRGTGSSFPCFQGVGKLVAGAGFEPATFRL